MSSMDFAELLLKLFFLAELTVVSFLVARDEFNVAPGAGFPDVSTIVSLGKERGEGRR